MNYLCLVDVGFVIGLIISIIIVGVLATLTVLVIKKKRTPVAIDGVVKDIQDGESCVLSGGRNYIVGASNKVKAGEYIASIEEDLSIMVGGVARLIKDGDTVGFLDGDNIYFEGANKKLTLTKSAKQ